MNASVFLDPSEIAPRRWQVPEAALRRLRHHLSRDTATDEAWQASLLYGADGEALHELVEHWLNDFELEAQPLFSLPSFELRLGGQSLGFVHLRSSERFAMPLLLLHGYSGSPAEFQQLLGPLSEPGRHGAATSDAFDVVCPCLPGFGGSDGASGARQAAEACAALMRGLGYERYVVHGSDWGANIALELAALDREHVAGLHVTAVPAYPSDSPEDAATLSRREKSQLACATERYQELCFSLPRSPVEGLAFALAQLADSPHCHQDTAARSSLLTSWCLAWALADADVGERNEQYRGGRLASAPSSDVPIALHDFPLDAPSLRRFAERRYRVVEWCEHEHGGGMPGVEQPQLLLESLRGFFRRLR
ncbi:MAG: epoxide hydrolase family protein [Myxococcales bacterium]